MLSMSVYYPETFQHFTIQRKYNTKLLIFFDISKVKIFFVILKAHCDEEMSNFEELCDLLTPDLPLLTMIRGTELIKIQIFIFNNQLNILFHYKR